jgi:hypothetical protein
MMLMRQSAILLSIISRAGNTNATALAALAAVVPGPIKSVPGTRAISGSIRGEMKREIEIGSAFRKEHIISEKAVVRLVDAQLPHRERGQADLWAEQPTASVYPSVFL